MDISDHNLFYSISKALNVADVNAFIEDLNLDLDYCCYFFSEQLEAKEDTLIILGNVCSSNSKSRLPFQLQTQKTSMHQELND